MREPWAASRVQGSPEPPKPFIAEQVFAKLSFTNALDLVPVPGLQQWLVVENGGKIWTLPDDAATAQADIALDIKALRPACDNVYGVAFHPKFRENREVFITYTNGDKLDDGSRLSRYKIASERRLGSDWVDAFFPTVDRGKKSKKDKGSGEGGGTPPARPFLCSDRMSPLRTSLGETRLH